jgi:hypothetical protein
MRIIKIGNRFIKVEKNEVKEKETESYRLDFPDSYINQGCSIMIITQFELKFISYPGPPNGTNFLKLNYRGIV